VVQSTPDPLDNLTIVRLDPDNWPTLAELFQQGGDPKNCWCTFWRMTNAEAAGLDAEDRKNWLKDRAEADPAVGLVALRDGAAVGWVSVGPREDFGRLPTSRTIPFVAGEGVWAVKCFVVAKAVRRQGLAPRLLNAAIAAASAQGAKVIEAHPIAPQPDHRVPAAKAYTGVESMFLSAGFSRVAESASNTGGLLRTVVRRTV
jgi:GNAT superfamily N-acetyltransferase